MLSKEQIISITRKRLNRIPIGCQYWVDEGVIFPNFKQPENLAEIPAMSGDWYINERTHEMDIMDLLDMIELKGKMETITF